MCALSVLAMYYRRTRYLAAVFVAAFAMSARAVASRGNLALCAAIRARSVHFARTLSIGAFLLVRLCHPFSVARIWRGS